MKERIAKSLLDIGAVELSPQKPFVWTSGIKSPIYCDNRLTLAYPDLRKEIAHGLVGLINAHFPQVTVIAGTATAGIPHAAWVADLLDLPMIYVRSKAKGHGKHNQIEGKLTPEDKAVVIEDLISTGGSSLRAAESIRQSGAAVLGVVAIFSYALPQAEEAFRKAGIPYVSLSDYPTLLQVARREGKLTEEELCKLKAWQPE
jgi:orotate phosphoribosyltransferase